jgi:hypothetical protein
MIMKKIISLILIILASFITMSCNSTMSNEFIIKEKTLKSAKVDDATEFIMKSLSVPSLILTLMA